MLSASLSKIDDTTCFRHGVAVFGAGGAAFSGEKREHFAAAPLGLLSLGTDSSVDYFTVKRIAFCFFW